MHGRHAPSADSRTTASMQRVPLAVSQGNIAHCSTKRPQHAVKNPSAPAPTVMATEAATIATLLAPGRLGVEANDSSSSRPRLESKLPKDEKRARGAAAPTATSQEEAIFHPNNDGVGDSNRQGLSVSVRSDTEVERSQEEARDAMVTATPSDVTEEISVTTVASIASSRTEHTPQVPAVRVSQSAAVATGDCNAGGTGADSFEELQRREFIARVPVGEQPPAFVVLGVVGTYGERVLLLPTSARKDETVGVTPARSGMQHKQCNYWDINVIVILGYLSQGKAYRTE